MSPEARARIGRVVMEVWRAGITAAKTGGSSGEPIRYAEAILENVVEEELQRRLAAPERA